MIDYKGVLMETFIKVEPIYTGGNIYCFLGQLDSKRWFFASSADYDVRIINADPWLEENEEDVWQPDWQDEHLIEDLNPNQALIFFTDMLKWISENQPRGNYSQSELDECSQEVEELKTQTNWR